MSGELIDMRQAELSTARLTMEPLAKAHSDEALAMFADPELSRYMSIDFSVPENARAMLERRLAYSGPPALGHWAIRESNGFVGMAHLRPSFELPPALIEIGWYVDTSQTGRGIAVEAGAALLEYGLSTLGLPAVWALIDARNHASRKVAERLGFIRVGCGHHYGALHEISVALPGPRHTLAEQGTNSRSPAPSTALKRSLRRSLGVQVTAKNTVEYRSRLVDTGRDQDDD